MTEKFLSTIIYNNWFKYKSSSTNKQLKSLKYFKCLKTIIRYR